MATYSLIGLFNPLDTEMCFSIPIFEKDNCHYTQVLNKKNVITGFDIFLISKKNLIIKPAIQNFSIGGQGVFSFYFSPTEIVFDTKIGLIIILKNRMSEFELKPFLLNEVADFIAKNEDDNKEKKYYKQIRDDANLKCELRLLKNKLRYFPRELNASESSFVMNIFNQYSVLSQGEIVTQMKERLIEETNHLYNQWMRKDEPEIINKNNQSSIYQDISTQRTNLVNALRSNSQFINSCQNEIMALESANLNEWILIASSISLSSNAKNSFLNWIANGIDSEKWNSKKLFNILKDEKLEQVTKKNILVNIAAQALKTVSILFDILNKRELLKPFITQLKFLDENEDWDQKFLLIAGKCVLPYWGVESFSRLFLITKEYSGTVTIKTSSPFLVMFLSGDFDITFKHPKEITVIMSKSNFEENLLPMRNIEKDILHNPYLLDSGRATVKSYILTNKAKNAPRFNRLREGIIGCVDSDHIIEREFFNYMNNLSGRSFSSV